MTTPHSIAILTTGSELFDGRVLDTNAHWLLREIAAAGLTCNELASCNDDQQRIIRNLRALAAHHRFIIMTGGLGPTTDDLTRSVLADMAGTKLARDTAALDRIVEYYRSRGRDANPATLQQAEIPAGSRAIPNPIGSAPGIHIELPGPVEVFALPGVPREMQAMWREYVLPYLRRTLPGVHAPRSLFWRIFGLPESEVQQRVSTVSLPPETVISYRVAFPEIHLTLKGVVSGEIDRAVTEALGEAPVISRTEELSFERVIYDLLLHRQATVGVAESMTGGLLGSLLTELPGSSQVFIGGCLTYTNNAKSDLLGVSPALLSAAGAVSAPVATQMAKGARAATNATYALSITGIAGPDGGSTDTPVGTFFVGLATQNDARSFRFRFSAQRDWVRRMATYTALDVLRREILSLPQRGS